MGEHSSLKRILVSCADQYKHIGSLKQKCVKIVGTRVSVNLRRSTLRKCLHHLRGRLRQDFSIALSERLRAKLENDVDGEIRAWKLFVLIPSVLLHRPRGAGSVGRSELAQWFEDYQQGRWADLVRRGLGTVDEHRSKSHSTDESEEQRRGRAALKRVQQGQVSRARQELTGAPLAPRDENTLNELRRRRPQGRLRDIPADALEFHPERELKLDAKIFAECLRNAPTGCSPGPGGCSNEILKVCLDDHESLALLTVAAEDFAKAAVPPCVFKAFMSARMTALSEPDGGIRGIATGTVFRRLVAKTLARQFGPVVEASCASVTPSGQQRMTTRV